MTFAPSVSRLHATTLPVAALTAAAVTLCARSASAGYVSPQLTVGVTVAGDAPQSVTSTSGFQIPGSGAYVYDGSIVSPAGSSWYVNWNLTGTDTTQVPNSPSITTNFAVGNTGDTTRVFQIQVSFASPVQAPTDGGFLYWLTNLSGVLSSNQGGVASLTGLTPSMLQGQINGIGVSNNNPSVASTTTASFLGPSASNYYGAIPNGPNVHTIGYLMTFSLSAHSTAVFNGSWYGTLVPAPGAVALLGLAGLAGRGRRRR